MCMCVIIFLMGTPHEVMVLSPRDMSHLAKSTVPGLGNLPFQLLLVRRIQVSITVWATAIALCCLWKLEGRGLLLKITYMGLAGTIWKRLSWRAALSSRRYYASCQGRGAVSSPTQCKAYKPQWLDQQDIPNGAIMVPSVRLPTAI